MRLNIIQNYAAAWVFGWTCVAVISRFGGKAHETWTLGRGEQKSIPARMPLISTTNKCSPLMGFFTSIAAVLHTIVSAKVGGVERIDERTLIDAGRARCAISQDAQKVGIKGVKSKATGFSIGAVVDTGYQTQHRTNKDGTANRTGSRREFTPTPALALLFAK